MRIENIASNVFGKSDLLIVFCLSLRMGDRQRDHPKNTSSGLRPKRKGKKRRKEIPTSFF